jgi:hypothetical protein
MLQDEMVGCVASMVRCAFWKQRHTWWSNNFMADLTEIRREGVNIIQMLSVGSNGELP